MTRFFMLPLLLCCTGCLLTVSDPEAEGAVEIYNELHSHLPEKSIDLATALRMAPAENAADVRLAFAKLEMLKNNPGKAEIRVRGEKARVELNVMLGFLPADEVVYQTDGALTVPEEISHIGAAEKAALIINGGKKTPLKLLQAVRFAHVDAVAAMNLLMSADTPENRFSYFAACIRLAAVIGVKPEQLDKLEEYEKRFNAASSRWQKEHENGE